MKVWGGYGSEHSHNLVMIGHFTEVDDAKRAKEIIDQITEQVRADEKAGKIKVGELAEHYPDNLLALLQKLEIYSLGPAELEQFAYDLNVIVEKDQVVVTTDEIDVSAFLKILIDGGARVEIYSAHVYPDTGQGRSGK